MVRTKHKQCKTLYEEILLFENLGNADLPCDVKYFSCIVRKPKMWFPNKSDTNRSIQAQKMARGLKSYIWKEEELYYLCSENKGADRLRDYHEADLCLCFGI